MNFKITKDIPMPPSVKAGRKSKYPFRSLTKVGQSFFIPLTAAPKGLQLNTTYWSMVYPDRDFAQRVVTEGGVEGIRVWRTK